MVFLKRTERSEELLKPLSTLKKKGMITIAKQKKPTI